MAREKDPLASADTFPLLADVLRRLASDPDPRMRELAPRDLNLPVALVRRLAADPDARVRRAIAAHPRLPPRELTELLSDSSERVAAAASGKTDLSPQHMHQLLVLAGLRQGRAERRWTAVERSVSTA
ncbi:hypothetical protein SALBM311S_11384 [Streptomyces alboniger]